VRAGAVDDGEALGRHVRQLGQDPAQQAVGRQRRVMSGMTTATRSLDFTVSRRGLPPSGWRTASVNAAPSSGNPSTNVGSMTRAFAEGRSMESPSFPYCR
jgi:hypothetical protein